MVILIYNMQHQNIIANANWPIPVEICLYINAQQILQSRINDHVGVETVNGTHPTLFKTDCEVHGQV